MKTKFTLLFYFFCLYSVIAENSVTDCYVTTDTYAVSKSGLSNAKIVTESKNLELAVMMDPLNLAENGDFEEETDASWTGDGTIETDFANSRSGTKALKFSTMAPSTQSATQSIAYSGFNASYTVQGYYKGTATAGTASIKIRFLNAGGSLVSEVMTNSYSSETSYRLMTTSFIVPLGTSTIEIMPQIEGATGTFWFDDIYLADNGNTTDFYSILRNADYNSGDLAPWDSSTGVVENDDVNGTTSSVLNVTVAAKQFSGSTQFVKVTPNSTYKLTGLIKRNMSEGFGRFFVRFRDSDDTSITSNRIAGSQFVSAFGVFGGIDLTYKPINIQNDAVIVPPAGAVLIELTLQLFNGVGTLWWENIMLEEILPEKQLSVETPGDVDNNFLVYPNPASEFINISLSNSKNRTLQMIEGVKIYDMGGRVVMNYNNLKDKFTSNEMRISVKTLSTGMYILRANFADGNSKAKLFEIK